MFFIKIEKYGNKKYITPPIETAYLKKVDQKNFNN